MSIRVNRTLVAVAALALVFSAVSAGPAYAQKKAKPKQVQGTYLSFDEATSTIKIKEKGKEKVYTIKPEGSILTRTAIKINGRGAKITELPPNSRIILYWIPDEKDPKMRFARTIDAPSIPEDLQEEFDKN
jgi:hypothetical protein